MSLSPSLSLIPRLLLRQDELSPPSPAGAVSAAVAGVEKSLPGSSGGNWVRRSDGSDGSAGSRAGTRGTGPVIHRVPAAPSEPGLIQQGSGALLLQARPLGHPLFAGNVK